MEFNLFKFGFNRLDCYKDICDNFYAETKEGYNILAQKFRSLLDSHFELSIDMDNGFMEISVHFIGNSFVSERSYRTYIDRRDFYADVNQVLTVLTAFASGVGYDY